MLLRATNSGERAALYDIQYGLGESNVNSDVMLGNSSAVRGFAMGWNVPKMAKEPKMAYAGVRKWCENGAWILYGLFRLSGPVSPVAGNVYFLSRRQYIRVTPKFPPKRQQSAPNLHTMTFSKFRTNRTS